MTGGGLAKAVLFDPPVSKVFDQGFCEVKDRMNLQAIGQRAVWATERGQVCLQSPQTYLPVNLAARFTLRGLFCGVV